MSAQKLLQHLLHHRWVTFPLEMSNEVEQARHIVHSFSEKREWDLLLREGCFRRIIKSVKLREVVDAVYGSGNYHLTSYSSNTVYPDASRGMWHTDHPYCEGTVPEKYADLVKKWSDTPLSLQIVIVLDTFKEENGATIYRPGGMSGDIRRFTAPSGTVVMYYGNLWHTSGQNLTSKPRSALLSNFAPLGVEPFLPPGATPIGRQISPADPDFWTDEKDRARFRV